MNSLSAVLPVGIVCGYIKQIFESEEMLHDITISGEVSNFKTVNGYSYFNLKDKDGILSCACFGLQKSDLPRDGDQVLVSGSLSFYPKGGRLSFIVSKINRAGIGEWMLFYSELLNRLKEEGLFDQSRKKAIPRFPRRVCVVTSKTGAVIRDIVRTIREKNDRIDVLLVDARVQGEDAVGDIVKGLRLADKSCSDVVILARGGGSWEELLPFCDERVARAVSDMETPVISAVGHETDTTLVDFVSDLRVATPTAAGECVTYSVSEQREYLVEELNYIASCVDRRILDLESKLTRANALILSKAENRYAKVSARLGVLSNRMSLGAENQLAVFENTLCRVMDRINAKNPINVLKNGLFKVSVKEKNLTNKSQVEVGDDILLESIDFKIKAEVKSVE